jgi:hypothetical protein
MELKYTEGKKEKKNGLSVCIVSCVVL